jgi:hypothetical protein
MVDGQDFIRDYKLLVSGFIIDGVITGEEQDILCDYLAEKNLDFNSPAVIKVYLRRFFPFLHSGPRRSWPEGGVDQDGTRLGRGEQR